MREAIYGTPIYWVNDKKASIDVDFEIHPLKAEVGEKLIAHLRSSTSLNGSLTKLIICGKSIEGVRYNFRLKNFEIDYFDEYLERIEEVIENLIDSYVSESGGYEKLRA